MTHEIGSVQFDDAKSLTGTLLMMQGDAELATEDKHAVVYVLGSDGTQFGTAKLYVETLTDGSKVAHIILGV